MQTASVEEVVSRIGRAAAALPSPTVIATDADGTIWSGDVGVDAFESLLERKAIRPQALAALQTVAREAGMPSSDDPNEVARVLYDACEKGAWPELAAYEMMTWVFAGWTTDEVRAFMREVIVERRLLTRMHAELHDAIEQARSDSLPVYVVSASPVIVVEESVAAAGLHVAGVIAAEPAVEDHVIQPRMASPLPYAHGKVAALLARVPGASVAAAFGDNLFDLEMLRLASVPVAIRPKPRLAERAHELPSMVQLAAR
ncbi:MAG: haloacid dehalogenase-like hydrolase [Deltaproteobacteria bacterium]|nr:haloacid dehalogenase-like hydrolase [Deltaproteobacteria bacterium]